MQQTFSRRSCVDAVKGKIFLVCSQPQLFWLNIHFQTQIISAKQTYKDRLF